MQFPPPPQPAFAPVAPLQAPGAVPAVGRDARLVSHAPGDMDAGGCCAVPGPRNPPAESVFSLPPRRRVPVRQIYLIVNPYGGKGKGRRILQAAREEFQKLGVAVSVLETTHRRHAEEYANSVPFVGFDALCAIGGDGTFNEVVNGLLTRQDKQRLPLGFIAGSHALLRAKARRKPRTCSTGMTLGPSQAAPAIARWST
jgi:hypothetical protein